DRIEIPVGMIRAAACTGTVAFSLRQLQAADLDYLFNDRTLRLFIQSVGGVPGNRSLIEGLEQVRTQLLNPDAKRPFHMEELTFESSMPSPWKTNDTVRAVVYRSLDGQGRRPAVIIPSYIHMHGMTRPLPLRLGGRGFMVLEVNLPLLAGRAVPGADGTLAERLAALEFGAAEFLQSYHQSVSDLIQAAQWAHAQPHVDASRVGVLGNSQRGN